MNILKNLFSRFTVSIKEKGGKNNINISPKAYLRKVRIKIYGQNNTLIIEDNAYLHNVYIRVGFPDCHINNCIIKIGNNTSFNSADIQLGESESSLIIGNDCMFSFNVEITCTDTHSIFDNENNLLNTGKEIIIGSHVWVCKNTLILKNTKIPDNCIVAQGAAVTKKFEIPNAVIAGNPARIVKQNINWSRIRPEKFKENINA